MDKETKHGLFHGSNRKRWHNAETTAKPSMAIETPFGMADITVNDDYTVSCMVRDLYTIWGVTYKIQGRMHLNKYTEDWVFANHTMRAEARPPCALGINWRSLTPSAPTPKARHKITNAMSPLLEDWLEKNWQLLGDGKRIGYINTIEKARAKIADVQAQLDMRKRWLDEVEAEFKRTGSINEPNEYFDLYGRYWRFD